MFTHTQIQNNLQRYYNNQSEKYAQTRNKFWSEKKLLLNTLLVYIDKYSLKKLRILEFGCGDGRFLREVLAKLPEDMTIEYIGVDISQGLLDIAKKDAQEYANNISAKFICADIVKYIETFDQESFDIVVGIASFQHIALYKQRLFLMKSFYRILKYDGILLMLNWSFSHRFIKKYWRPLLGGIKRYLLSFGKEDRNSLYLPWKAKTTTFYRFYHIFLLSEFRDLVLFSSFVTKKLCYVDKKGNCSDIMKNAKNTFFVAKKTVLS